MAADQAMVIQIHQVMLVALYQKMKPLLLEVFNNCNQPIYSQNIGPYSSNTNLGTITVTIPAINYLQITGSAVNCSNQPVTNGNALIYFDGHLYNKPISNGNFSLTVTRCSNSTATIEVVVVDNTSQRAKYNVERNCFKWNSKHRNIICLWYIIS